MVTVTRAWRCPDPGTAAMYPPTAAARGQEALARRPLSHTAGGVDGRMAPSHPAQDRMALGGPGAPCATVMALEPGTRGPCQPLPAPGLRRQPPAPRRPQLQTKAPRARARCQRKGQASPRQWGERDRGGHSLTLPSAAAATGTATGIAMARANWQQGEGLASPPITRWPPPPHTEGPHSPYRGESPREPGRTFPGPLSRLRPLGTGPGWPAAHHGAGGGAQELPSSPL